MTAHYDGAPKITRVERFIADYFDDWHRQAKADARRKPDEKRPDVLDLDADEALAWEQWLRFTQDVLDETQHESKRSTENDED